MSAEIKIGCDPELFAIENGGYCSVHTWLKGSKKEPFKVERGYFQVDGVAAEFNIDPATSASEFDDNVRGVVEQLKKEAKQHNVSLVASPIATFGSAWNTIPAENKVLGCDPDYGKNGEPLFSKETEHHLNNSRTRTGAGHLHIGWGDNIVITPDHLADCIGVSTVFEEVWENVENQMFSANNTYRNRDITRAKYYGLPYAHRPKPYGVELRKPSNSWLNYRDSKNSYGWVFNVVYHMMDRYMNEPDIARAYEVRVPQLYLRGL